MTSNRSRHSFYDEVTLIDAGENTTEITCSNCGADIEVGWFFDLIEEKGEAFGNLDVEAPAVRRSLRWIRYAATGHSGLPVSRSAR